MEWISNEIGTQDDNRKGYIMHNTIDINDIVRKRTILINADIAVKDVIDIEERTKKFHEILSHHLIYEKYEFDAQRNSWKRKKTLLEMIKKI